MNRIENDFKNAVNDIANNPTIENAKANVNIITEAHKKLERSEFWGYVERMDVRELVEEILVFDYDFSLMPALDNDSPENLKKTNDFLDAFGRFYGYDLKK